MDLVKREKFDLIICDLNISDQVDGELIRSIYQVNPALQFIIISAQEIPDHLKAESDLKISAYFEKPFNISDFGKAIQNIENVKFSKVEL
jgi:DNA-binding NarL/FixJ family response regulator